MTLRRPVGLRRSTPAAHLFPASLLCLFALLLAPQGAVSAQTVVTARALADLLTYPSASAPAEVHSLNDSRISAEIMAPVEAVPVRVGDRVEKGELLVSLDCREFDSILQAQAAAVRELDAQIALAESQLARAERLREQRNVSVEEVERRRTELDVYSARRRTMEQQRVQAALKVEDCRITAPFAGVVRERLVQLGELTTPGAGLIRLQQTDAVEVSAQVEPETDLTAVDHLAYLYRGRTLAIKVRRQLPVIEPRARTREVRLVFTAEAAPPGSSGRLRWTERRGRLPGDLLVRRQQGLGVFVSERGVARFKPLPGAVEGQPAPVDLPLDSRVILEGRQGLVDGDEVVER